MITQKVGHRYAIGWLGPGGGVLVEHLLHLHPDDAERNARRVAHDDPAVHALNLDSTETLEPLDLCVDVVAFDVNVYAGRRLAAGVVLQGLHHELDAGSDLPEERVLGMLLQSL